MSDSGLLIVVAAGCGIGLLGGVIGTWAGIRNTNGPRERAFAIKASLAAWVAMLLITLPFLFVGHMWIAFAWIPYTALMMFGVRYFNKKQAMIREEELSDQNARHQQ